MQNEPQPNIDCQLFFGNQMVRMESRKDHRTNEVSIQVEFVGKFFPAEFIATANAVRQVIEAYQRGIDIERWFTPDRNVERDSEMIKCQWRSDGTLRVIEEHAEKKYMHAEVVEEALTRSRNFTCSRYVYRVCPKRRGKAAKDA